MAPIKPFTITIPDEALKKLKQRLELTEFPSEPAGDSWAYGVPLADIKRLTTYWKDHFDWRVQEQKLNSLPQYTTEVSIGGFGTIDMHFLHQKSSVEGAIPLLFVHGWPGSFLEVTKMLPHLLGGQGKPAFHVVAPSLPNFVFSSGTSKPGFAATQYAEALHKVMLALGYDQYVTQGGDWGFILTRTLALLYPAHALATHTNWPFTGPPPDLSSDSNQRAELTPREQSGLARGADWWSGDGRGYLAIQSTKPQTCAYFLRDSPVALLAWIYEKLVAWTDAYPWTEDEVLLWVSMYYFSRAGPEASAFIYYEALHDTKVTVAMVQGWIETPLGLAYFPKEIYAAPEEWARKNMGLVKQVTVFEKGGHFAGWERPEDLAGDVSKMFGKGGPVADLIDGKSGY